MNKLLKINVKSLCRTRHIPEKKVEKDLGLPEKAIYHLDENMPSLEKVAAFADYFGVSIDSLIGRGTDLPVDEELLLRRYRCLDKNSKETLLAYVEFLRSQMPVKKETGT